MAIFNNKQNATNDPIDIAQQQRMREQQEVEAAFLKGITELRDFIAPSSLEFSSSEFKLGTYFARTMYVFGYPRQIFTGWLSPIVNIDEELDMSMFIYPVASQIVLENLRKKVTQLEAGLMIDAEKGRTRDPGKQAAISDAEQLRDALQVGEERFFRFGLYLTVYAKSLEELDFIQHKIETVLGQQLVYSKVASSQFFVATKYRRSPSSAQHEHWGTFHKFPIYLSRPHARKRYSLWYQHAQQRSRNFRPLLARKCQHGCLC